MVMLLSNINDIAAECQQENHNIQQFYYTPKLPV